MKKFSIIVLVLTIVLGLSLSNQAAAKDKVITWKMQASYPVGTTVMMNGVEWAKAIEKLTNGRLKIQIDTLDVISIAQAGS